MGQYALLAGRAGGQTLRNVNALRIEEPPTVPDWAQPLALRPTERSTMKPTTDSGQLGPIAIQPYSLFNRLRLWLALRLLPHGVHAKDCDVTITDFTPR